MPNWVADALALLALVGSILTWVMNWREDDAKRGGAADVRDRVTEKAEDGLRDDIREFREEMRTAIDEMRKSSNLASNWQASQDKVNLYTAKAIESLTAQGERHAEKLNDHASSLKLLTELITRQQPK